jgi:hypothetical protein
MRMTAASRILGGPAVATHQFAAIAETGQVAAATEFPQQCYTGVGLDYLDPAQASQDPCDLRLNRDQAVSALYRLDKILNVRGWRPDSTPGPHWYSRTYRRPVIRCDQPDQDAAVPLSPARAIPLPKGERHAQ